MNEETISDELIETVCQRLSQEQQIRRTLPLDGRLHIDRPLPFLCVYRRPPKKRDEGTETLVMGEASYLIVSGQRQLKPSLTRLIRRMSEILVARFGAFLII